MKRQRYVPWFLPRKDGKHAMIITERRLLGDYMFETLEECQIYMCLVLMRGYQIYTSAVGTFPDLELDKDDDEVYRVLRPISLALFTREAVKRTTKNVEFPQIDQGEIETAIDKYEGFKSIKYKRRLDAAMRELKAEKEAALQNMKLSRETIKEMCDYLLAWYQRGVKADLEWRTPTIKTVAKKLVSRPLIALYILAIIGLLFYRGVI